MHFTSCVRIQECTVSGTVRFKAVQNIAWKLKLFKIELDIVENGEQKPNCWYWWRGQLQQTPYKIICYKVLKKSHRSFVKLDPDPHWEKNIPDPGSFHCGDPWRLDLDPGIPIFNLIRILNLGVFCAKKKI